MLARGTAVARRLLASRRTPFSPSPSFWPPVSSLSRPLALPALGGARFVRWQTQVAEVDEPLPSRKFLDSEAIYASTCCAQAAIDRWRGLAPLKPSAIAEGNEVALQGTVNSISPAGNILHITPDPRPPASLMPNLPDSVTCTVRCGTVLPKERVMVRGHWLLHGKRGWTISFNQNAVDKAALPAEVKLRGQPALLASHVASPSLDDENLPSIPFAAGIVMPDLREGSWDHAAFVRLLCSTNTRVLTKNVEKTLSDFLDRHGSQHLLKILNEGNEKALMALPGIAKGRASVIIQAFRTMVVRRQVEAYLVAMSHLSSGTILACSREVEHKYGTTALTKLTADPYKLLLELDASITLPDVDAIVHGQMLLLPTKEARNDLRERLRVQRRDMAAVLSLRAAESDGHSCLPAEKICSSATSLLRKNCKIMGRDTCDVAHLADMTARDLLVPEEVEGTECYYLSDLYDVEREVARRLRAMALAPPPWKQSLEERDPAWISELGDDAALSAQQREMATKLLRSKLAILTGGPGTGKTTLLRCVVDTLEANGQRILLCSPTGRASRRLSEATGRPTSTVHMATAMNLSASADVVIVDEASVLDVRILVRLMQQMAPKAALYFVGDADQLPPVGPSHVLQALLDTDLVPVHRLTQVHRQAAQSDLVEIARRFNDNAFVKVPHHCHDLASGSDFAFVSCSTDNRIDMIEKLVTREIPSLLGSILPDFQPARDIQVVAPKKNVMHTINKRLQRAFLPMRRIKRRGAGFIFFRGDKVMQLVNDYTRDICNGDVGFVAEINLQKDSPYALSVKFGPESDSHLVNYTEDQLDNLSLAYAITIHKAQGSEYPVVILPINSSDGDFVLRRKLVYTAMTRAQKLLVIVGDEHALRKAQTVVNNREEERWSKLPVWLSGEGL